MSRREMEWRIYATGWIPMLGTKYICWNPNPWMWWYWRWGVFGRWLDHEGGALTNAICALTRHPREFSGPFCHGKIEQEDSYLYNKCSKTRVKNRMNREERGRNVWDVSWYPRELSESRGNLSGKSTRSSPCPQFHFCFFTENEIFYFW